MKYRAEIDGLRAVAVVPVILFHAGYSWFQGGFVGVDIFFVISGYLITGLLLEDLSRGQFSILKFYERRARRILPALVFVLLCCIPFAWLWMVPSDMKNFGQGLVAIAFFASNIFFYRQSGYFEPEAEENPLLHTWSLSVEEQYYVVFPIFLLLMWRFGVRRAFLAVVGLAVLSLALSEWAWRVDPSANFYLAPTRAWELLAGSICAFLQRASGQRSNGALAAIGLGLIVFSILYYDETVPFPSLYALAPVGGTVLIILFAGSGTQVSRLLSVRAIVGIGLISYSAYLWHQPLLAFARIRAIFEPHPAIVVSLVLVSFALAYMSWRFVEAPFRRRPTPVLTQTGVFTASAAVLLALIGFGLFVHLRDGMPNRPVASIQQPLIDTARKRDLSYALLRDPLRMEALQERFLSGDTPKRVLVLGDSHSKDMFNAFVLNQPSFPDATFLRLDLPTSCRLPDGDNIYVPCPNALWAQHPDVMAAATHIVFSMRWHEKEQPLALIRAYLEGLADSGKTLIVMSNTVEYEPEAPDLIRMVVAEQSVSGTNAFPKPMADTVFYTHQSETVEAFNRTLETLMPTFPDVRYVEKASFICEQDARRCVSVTPSNEAVYYDYGHWTVEGAQYLGQRMIKGGLLDEF